MPRRIRYDAWSPDDGRRTRRGGVTMWTSPWCEPGFRFTDLVASWQADTSGGSWIEVGAQARGERGWHALAHWQAGSTATCRSSGRDPQVDTDVWRPPGGADGYRLRVTAHPSASGRTPVLGRIGAVVSTGTVRVTTSSPLRREERVLDVPRLSQMTWAEVGGRGWCSPTSVSMVLAHAGTLPPTTDTGTVDINRVAREVFDPAYEGTGNWSFNTAWAATLADHAFVTRLHDLRDAERFVDAGIPLVASVGYPRGALRGAPTHGTAGHLVVIRGFTADGDVVTNDPGAPTERSVRRTYDRGQFERAWLGGSGGLVYVIHRDDQLLPRGAWSAANA
ncbi:MAG TPA: peptidase C39 family protein [Nocardioides sp.]|uniref:peptidase C39 family protein n=1 Tax=Nocardioides sp. TaxID=35761 RepID=UPI002F4134A9